MTTTPRGQAALLLAPGQPGKYIAEIDVVWEGIAWLKEKGGGTAFVDPGVTPVERP